MRKHVAEFYEFKDMFGQGLMDRFLGVREVSGLHWRFGAEGEWCARSCVLEKRKQKLVRKGDVHEFSGWDEIGQGVSSGLPVFLQLEGKGVLCKVLSQPVDSVEEAFEVVMPHARFEEFYCQLSTLERQQWLCVVRREMVSGLLNRFQSLGYFVTGLGLGPFALQNVAPFVREEVLQVEDQEVHFSQGGIEQIIRKKGDGSTHCLVGDERVKGADVMAYATALGAFVDRQGAGSAELEGLLNQQEEWKQKQLFLLSGKAILVLLFVGMLVNALLNFQYSQEHAQLSFEAGRDERLVSRLQQLQDATKQKEEFLGQIGWDGADRLAFYADRLGAGSPKGVRWTKLEIYPLNERLLRKEKQFEFDKKRLHIEGYCEGPLALNAWLKQLNELEWVQEVSGQQYAYDRREEKGKFKFDLIIN